MRKSSRNRSTASRTPENATQSGGGTVFLVRFPSLYRNLTVTYRKPLANARGSDGECIPWGSRAAAPGCGSQLLLDGGLVGQGVVDVDLGHDFHGFAVEQGLLIDPQPDGFERGGDQQRVAADHGQVDDVAFLADEGREVNYAGDAGLLGERRIDGFRLRDQFGLLDVAADGDPLGSVGRRRGRGGRSAGGHGADDAAEDAALDAARHLDIQRNFPVRIHTCADAQVFIVCPDFGAHAVNGIGGEDIANMNRQAGDQIAAGLIAQALDVNPADTFSFEYRPNDVGCYQLVAGSRLHLGLHLLLKGSAAGGVRRKRG